MQNRKEFQSSYSVLNTVQYILLQTHQVKHSAMIIMCLQHKHFQSCTRTQSCSHVCKHFSALQWFSLMKRLRDFISDVTVLSELAVVTSVRRTRNRCMFVFLYYLHIYASTSRWRWKWQHCRKSDETIKSTNMHSQHVWMNRGTDCM